MVVATDLMARIREEYKRMLERWESGNLYYHFKTFIKNYAKTGWLRYGSVKEAVCAILALSRLGLPITTPLVAALLMSGKELAKAEVEAREKLFYLASYGIIEPAEVSRTSRGWFVRRFKVSKTFLEVMYLPLTKTLGSEEASGNAERDAREQKNSRK